jgi:hypothetical protein
MAGRNDNASPQITKVVHTAAVRMPLSAPRIWPLHMMRITLILTLIASPGFAWEFTPDPVCTVTHDTPQATLRLTYDPRVPQYAITLTQLDRVWADGPIFAMRFDGPRPIVISTNRHVLSDGNTAVTVTDSGFGNVLDGLEFNDTAVASVDGTQLDLPLAGAARAIAAFRACASGASV